MITSSRLSKKVSNILLAMLLVLPAGTYGAQLGGGALNENNGSVSLVDFLGSIQTWLLGIVGALAVLFIVYGGFLYVTSGGNKTQLESAKKTLTYAILGLLLVVLAGFIFQVLTGGFLTSIFGGKSL